MRELENGRHISFWFDNWCEKGVLFSLLGECGIVSMGISRDATVEEAVRCVRRKRRHRSQLLNDVEAQLVMVKEKLSEGVEDEAES